MFDCTFSLLVHLPHSKFNFTPQVQPIIEEVDYDVEVVLDPDAMAVSIYDPPSSRAYVRMIEAELQRRQEAFAQALKDHAHVEQETKKWVLIGGLFL